MIRLASSRFKVGKDPVNTNIFPANITDCFSLASNLNCKPASFNWVIKARFFLVKRNQLLIMQFAAQLNQQQLIHHNLLSVKLQLIQNVVPNL